MLLLCPALCSSNPPAPHCPSAPCSTTAQQQAPPTYDHYAPHTTRRGGPTPPLAGPLPLLRPHCAGWRGGAALVGPRRLLPRPLSSLLSSSTKLPYCDPPPQKPLAPLSRRPLSSCSSLQQELAHTQPQRRLRAAPSDTTTIFLRPPPFLSPGRLEPLLLPPSLPLLSPRRRLSPLLPDALFSTVSQTKPPLLACFSNTVVFFVVRLITNNHCNKHTTTHTTTHNNTHNNTQQTRYYTSHLHKHHPTASPPFPPESPAPILLLPQPPS